MDMSNPPYEKVPGVTRKWVTADLHLGHANMIRLAHRPFDSVEEMDAELIKRWNSRVEPGDLVYVLGDWAWHTDAHINARSQLNGTKILFRGNHDKRVNYNDGTFHRIYDTKRIKVNKHSVWLSHYAHRSWPAQIQLYGHSHGNLPDNGSPSFDMGVDVWDFYPVNLEWVVAELAKRLDTFSPEDHHGRKV